MYQKFVSFTVLSTTLSIIALPSYALPGQTPQQALQRVKENPLTSSLEFSTTLNGYGNPSFYIAQATIGEYPVTLRILFPSEDAYPNTRDSGEIVEIRLTSVASELGQRSYEPRQDEVVLQLASGFFGESVVQDFRDSRFTDLFALGDTYRAAYKGSRFGYILTRENSTYQTPFSIRICSHDDWEILRQQDEYEERI